MFKLTPLLLNTTYPVLANSVDPDQLASEEANWSGSALFVIKYVNFYQKPRSSNLIGWNLEVGVAIYSAREGLSSLYDSTGRAVALTLLCEHWHWPQYPQLLKYPYNSLICDFKDAAIKV